MNIPVQVYVATSALSLENLRSSTERDLGFVFVPYGLTLAMKPPSGSRLTEDMPASEGWRNSSTSRRSSMSTTLKPFRQTYLKRPIFPGSAFPTRWTSQVVFSALT